MLCTVRCYTDYNAILFNAGFIFIQNTISIRSALLAIIVYRISYLAKILLLYLKCYQVVLDNCYFVNTRNRTLEADHAPIYVPSDYENRRG